MPGRKSKTTKEKEPPKVLPSFSGNLQRIDNKTIVLELDDYRVLEFRRNDKTRFLKGEETAKPEIFKLGDRVSIEGEQDAEAFLTAVNVYWEKAGDGKVTHKSDDGPTEEQIAAAEKAQDEAKRGGSGAPSASAPSPPARDPDDPDRPVLHRADSRPATPPAAPSAAPPAPSAAPAPPPARVPAEPEVPVRAERATEVAPPPAAPDPDDPGPPMLKRGKPAPRKVSPAQRDDDEPVTIASAAPAAPGSVAAVPSPAAPPRTATIENTDAPLQEPQGDAFIRKAQETALEFTETLPNYVCQEMIARSYSDTQPVNWRPIDVVTTEVVYENGKEEYRNVAVNGKATKKPIEESGGAWSTGEFGTVLIDIFSPATGADFRFRRQSRIAGIEARLYDFTVERENSHWTIHTGAQTYRPAYKGSVWVDPRTSRVLRIEMEARNLPYEFPLDKVESATDYEYVRLGGVQQFLLPVHAETLSCQRGTARCSRNAIDFRNYHKYSGESNIQFGGPKQ